MSKEGELDTRPDHKCQSALCTPCRDAEDHEVEVLWVEDWEVKAAIDVLGMLQTRLLMAAPAMEGDLEIALIKRKGKLILLFQDSEASLEDMAITALDLDTLEERSEAVQETLSEEEIEQLKQVHKMTEEGSES